MDNHTANAVRILTRDEEEACRRALELAVEQPEPAVPEAWDRSNPKNYTSVVQLTTAEFNSWCDAGRPPLHPRASRVAPAPVSRTSGARSGVSGAELRAFALMIAEESGALAGELRKEIAWLKADTESAHTEYKTIGKLVDQHARELAQMKRDAELEKKLESQRSKRRVESLEIALIAAGRNPAEHEDGEADLPDFREWRGHAQ